MQNSLPSDTVSKQAALSRIMAYVFAALNGIFIIALVTTLSAEGLFPSGLYIGIAVILIAASFNAAVRASVSKIIQTRLAVFLPIVWFIGSCTIYYQGSMATRAR